MLKNISFKIRKFLHLTNEIKEYRKKGVNIGENCHFFNCNLDCARGYLIEIGNNCTLTNCTILTHDASTQLWLKKTKVGYVKIGDNTFIGWGVIILPNVKIGKNCIIGAGSVVLKDIPDNCVAAGNPCKVISSIEDFQNKHNKMLKIKPIFTKHYLNKTQKEKEEEKNILKDTFGYDI